MEQIRTVEVPDCPLCGRMGSQRYQNIRDWRYLVPGSWSLSHCVHCDVLWLNPRPHPDELSKCYPSTYRTHLPDGEAKSLLKRLYWKVRAPIVTGILSASFGYSHLHTNLLGRLGALLGIIPPVKDYVGRSVMFLNYSDRGKLLDVGCGDGSYLAFMKELGYQALGIDPDPEAVRVAKEYYGITVYCGTIDQVELAEEEFDAITIRHVIEHMHDPMAALQASYKLLKPGGKLVILTPNVRSLIHFLFKDAWSLDPPRHLILFSPKALRRMVEDAGFNVVLFKTIPSPWYLETVWLYRIKQMNARLNVLGSIIFALARIFHLGIAVFHNICHPFLPDRGDEIAIVAEKPRSLISD